MKFPSSKILNLNWYQAAICQLILFKQIKQKLNNTVFFVITQKGIVLEAVNQDLLEMADRMIRQFFQAKIELLPIGQTQISYQEIITELKQYSAKLRAKKDSIYTNLIDFTKLQKTCQAFQKHGYLTPKQELKKLGQAVFLIVNPEHRWNEVINFINQVLKRLEKNNQAKESRKKQFQISKTRSIEIDYEHFIWLCFRNQYSRILQNLRQHNHIIDIAKENKFKLNIIYTNPHQLEIIEKQIQDIRIQVIHPKHCQLLALVKCIQQNQITNQQVQFITSQQIQNVAFQLWEGYNIPSIVTYLVNHKQLNGMKEFLWIMGLPEHIQSLKSRILKFEQNISSSLLNLLSKIQVEKISGFSCPIVAQYRGREYVCKQYDQCKCLLKQYRIKHPSIAKFYYYIERGGTIYLLRKHFKTSLVDYLVNVSFAKKCRVAYQILKSYQFLKQERIVLDGLKLQNLFMDNNNLKIVDLGMQKWYLNEPDWLLIEKEIWIIGFILYYVFFQKKIDVDLIEMRKIQIRFSEKPFKPLQLIQKQIVDCILNSQRKLDKLTKLIKEYM